MFIYVMGVGTTTIWHLSPQTIHSFSITLTYLKMHNLLYENFETFEIYLIRQICFILSIYNYIKQVSNAIIQVKYSYHYII